MTEDEFAALKCLVNYARNQNRCSLDNAKAHARRMGHSQDSVDHAVIFWARYEGEKKDRGPNEDS